MHCQTESVLFSFLISSLFVISLYVWPTNLPRNSPHTIRRRFLMTSITVLTLLMMLNMLDKFSLSDLVFDPFSWHFIVNGLVKPLFILATIQSIPILMFVSDLKTPNFTDFDIKSVRDYIFGPILEEFTYRFMLLRLLYPCFSATNATLISSFLFGFSHFHHYLLDPAQGRTLISTCAQFTFTFLFGLFVSSMYMKSTYIITPIILHSLCNLLGLPDFKRIGNSNVLTLIVSTTFFIGICMIIKF